jgi:hypothetical protein
MDDRHFDQLTRLAATGTRRDYLRLVAATLVMPFLMRASAGVARLDGTIVQGGVCAAAEEFRPTSCGGPAIPVKCADN